MKKNISIIILVFLSHFGFGQLATTNKDLPCLHKTFNLHFHIIMDSLRSKHIGWNTIENGLKDLNEKFKPICVDFKLCRIDTIYDYAFDSMWISQEFALVKNLYASDNMFNVFILTDLYIDVDSIPQKICGLSGNSILLGNGCFGALAHEFGHNFGLAHTFQGHGKELVNGANCATEGDRICDTPADPYIIFDDLKYYINGNCEFIGTQKDANGEYYTPHVANVMSYYDCPCNHFTREQFLVMANVIVSSYLKFW